MIITIFFSHVLINIIKAPWVNNTFHYIYKYYRADFYKKKVVIIDTSEDVVGFTSISSRHV